MKKKFKELQLTVAWKVVEKGYGSLTCNVIQSSHIKTSLKIDDVCIVHGYFQFLLCIGLSDGITDEE